MGLSKKVIESINGLPNSAKSVQFLSKPAEMAAKSFTSNLPLQADNKNHAPTTLKAVISTPKNG